MHTHPTALGAAYVHTQVQPSTTTLYSGYTQPFTNLSTSLYQSVREFPSCCHFGGVAQPGRASCLFGLLIQYTQLLLRISLVIQVSNNFTNFKCDSYSGLQVGCYFAYCETQQNEFVQPLTTVRFAVCSVTTNFQSTEALAAALLVTYDIQLLVEFEFIILKVKS